MKTIAISIFATLCLFNQLALAQYDCPPTTHIYKNEADDVGVTLPLKYSCEASASNDEITEVCIYFNQKLVSITGNLGELGLDNDDYSQHRVSDSGSTVTGSLGQFSIVSKSSVKFEINKRTGQGKIQASQIGLSPDGFYSNSESGTLSCR